MDAFPSLSSQTNETDVADVRRAETSAAALTHPQTDAVYTRPEVASLILDLVGYVAYKPVHEWRFVDPAAGPGAILLEAIDRLILAWRVARGGIADLNAAIRAFEIDPEVYQRLCARVRARLQDHNLAPSDIERLVALWCVNADFLSASNTLTADVIVANPPYRCYGDLSKAERLRLREDFKTFRGRCDLYVAFVERALAMLPSGGVLGVITPDRWLRTSYGAKLRQHIADGFHLRLQIDASDQPIFSRDVAAYPAISIIAHAAPGITRIARMSDVSTTGLHALAQTLTECNGPGHRPWAQVQDIPDFAHGAAPWLRGSPQQIAMVSRLMASFPSLSQAGCRVGNGLSTGENRVYVADQNRGALAADVEPEFWMPTVLPEDVSSGDINWRGRHLLNLWGQDGKLAEPWDHPGLSAYLLHHRCDLEDRYVARHNPEHWYRTIDRVQPGLCSEPKLLVADIQLTPRFALDPGRFYPRNGVYHVRSKDWPLPALRLVLESGLAHLIIAATAPTVRGGGYRCQAQYLAKIPLVHWADVAPDLKQALIEAAGETRQPRPDLVARLFDLSPSEEQIMQHFAGRA